MMMMVGGSGAGCMCIPPCFPEGSNLGLATPIFFSQPKHLSRRHYGRSETVTRSRIGHESPELGVGGSERDRPRSLTPHLGSRVWDTQKSENDPPPKKNVFGEIRTGNPSAETIVFPTS